jgi:predicted permease
MSGIVDDVRIGLRGLTRHRGFALAAVLSVALGAGANTTVFTLLNAVLLRPLPVEDPGRLVALFTVDAHNPGNLFCSYPNYKDYRDRNQVFSSLLLYSAVSVNLTGRGDPQSLVGEIVSGNYFPTLGVRMALGRSFTPEEDSVPDANPVAVIGYDLWMRQFGGDRQLIGRALELNGRAYAIVGVAPRGFQGLDTLAAGQVWVPMMMYRRIYPYPAWVDQRRALLFPVVGRLKPGISLRQAEASLGILVSDLEREYPRDNRDRRVKLMSVTEAAISPANRPTIARAGAALGIVATLVLLIACCNVANLLLARGAARGKEISVRLAMGASRWRLVRQLLIESTVLALLGGATGLLFARWARDILWSMRPPVLAFSAVRLNLDFRVLGYALAVSLAASLLFGLAPALRVTRTDLACDLKERAGPAPSSHTARSVLVVAQVALSLVALIGAGLFVRSLSNATRVDLGFTPERLGTLAFDVADWNYEEDRGREFDRRVLESAAAVPGVAAAALAKDPPFKVSLARTVLLPGRESGGGRFTLTSLIGPGYLRTTGIPLLAGRDFGPLDGRDAVRVAIVNEAAAAYYWPGENTLGKRMRFYGDERLAEVVGVARNANYQTVGEPPQALIYLPLTQNYSADAVLYIRARGDQATTLTAVRRAVQPLDRNLRLETETVDRTIRQALWAPRLTGLLLGAFGLLAGLLSTIGIYGVVSYSVSQRTREIGVRMALGAKPRDVQLGVIREGLRLVGAGVVAGLGIALVATRGIQSLLLATSARDAVTFVTVPIFLTLVGLAACWLPALRATRIDPSTALRDE